MPVTDDEIDEMEGGDRLATAKGLQAKNEELKEKMQRLRIRNQQIYWAARRMQDAFARCRQVMDASGDHIKSVTKHDV